MELIGQIPINWSWARQVGGQAGEGDHRELRSSYSQRTKAVHGKWLMMERLLFTADSIINQKESSITLTAVLITWPCPPPSQPTFAILHRMGEGLIKRLVISSVFKFRTKLHLRCRKSHRTLNQFIPGFDFPYVTVYLSSALSLHVFIFPRTVNAKHIN